MLKNINETLSSTHRIELQKLNNKLDTLGNEKDEDESNKIDELEDITAKIKNDIINSENEYTNLTSENEELKYKLEKLEKVKEEKKT